MISSSLVPDEALLVTRDIMTHMLSASGPTSALTSSSAAAASA